MLNSLAEEQGPDETRLAEAEGVQGGQKVRAVEAGGQRLATVELLVFSGGEVAAEPMERVRIALAVEAAVQQASESRALAEVEGQAHGPEAEAELDWIQRADQQMEAALQTCDPGLPRSSAVAAGELQGEHSRRRVLLRAAEEPGLQTCPHLQSEAAL